MKRIVPVFVCIFLYLPIVSAQMWDASLQDTLYGNEWIDFSQPDNYFKIEVGENGIYRIPFDRLPATAQTVEGRQFKLFAFGKEVPLYATNAGNLNQADYLEFFGEKNTTQLEKHLFKSEEEILNPYYSLFTDTTTYFLTWNGAADGQRVQAISNDLTNPPAKETHYTATSLFMDPVQSIRDGNYIGGHVIEDSQMNNEGFGTPYDWTHSISVPVSNGVTNAGNGKLEIKYNTAFNRNHAFEFAINGNPVKLDSFFGFNIKLDTFTIQPSDLTDDITVNLNELYSRSFRSSITYAKLEYPRRFSYDNSNYAELPITSSTQSRYFELEMFDLSGGESVVIWDVANNRRINATIENNLVKFVLPGAAKAPRLVVYNNQNGFKEVTAMENVSFVNYLDNTGNFLFISHPHFINSNGRELQDYAAYRQSQEGGGYEALILDIYQLYDQFGYGIKRNPICVRNFLHFAEKNWRDSLAYLILAGKPRGYPDIRSEADLALSHNKTFFVPIFGYNVSDNLMATDNYSYVPILPVGRLAVTNPTEIGDYLKKVRDYENTQRSFSNTIGSKEWTKRVVHLSGGGGASERAAIQSLLSIMENVIEAGKMGAAVTTYYKRTSDVIIESQTEGLKELINEGISILTFFGHSNPSVLDFNFDDPDSYDNFGKYPLLISNGCFSGNCATGVSGVGERFITARDKGAIGYYASSGFGFTGALFELGAAFYQNQTSTNYGNSIGNILSVCINELQGKQSLSLQSLLQQTIYQGDPAMKIHAFPGPDYVIDRSSVSIDPPFLNVELDSFTVNFDMVDIGMTLPDTSFLVKVEHRLPNGTINLLTEKRMEAPLNRSSHSITVPFIGGKDAIGQNRLFITIDSDNEIAELPTGAEGNNELKDNFGNRGLEMYIVSNDVLPLSPFKYAMTPDGNPTLYASTVSFFPEKQNFVFEIDTLRSFSSDWKVKEVVNNRGGLVKWTPTKELKHGNVYYWRVSPDSTGLSSTFRWQESSFMYNSQDSLGWNQSHYQQFKENDSYLLDVDTLTKKLSFSFFPKDLKLRNYIFEYPSQYPRIYLENKVIFDYRRNQSNRYPVGLIICVLDTVSAEPVINIGGGIYGNEETRNETINVFPFSTENEQERAEVITFLEDVIPSGYYVAIMTVQRDSFESYRPEEWAADTLSLGKSIFTVLGKQGITRIQELAELGSVPYNLFYKKDDPNWPVQEMIGSYQGIIELNEVLLAVQDSGYMTSPPIGPCLDWNQLDWLVSAIDTSGYDSYKVNLFGIRPDKTDSLIMSLDEPGPVDISFIDPHSFPFLKMEYHAGDSLRRSPAQLEYWRISYQPLPELALAPQVHYTFNSDTLAKGEPLHWEMAIENIGQTNFDSVQVRYRITDQSNSTRIIDKWLPALASKDTLHARLNLETDTFENRYNLAIEVNPERQPLERTFINNYGQIQTLVEADVENPTLDVTFDGERILDGAIISAKPEIIVLLRDNNPFALLDDPSDFSIEIKKPEEDSWETIPQNSPEFAFEPATDSGKNEARILYRPTFEENGTYQLRVKAADKEGNKSGQYDYTISFEVITDTRLSKLVNYPNPFTTSTRFAYTLTGSEPIVDYKIQVLTVSGRIVRELTAMDLGILTPGTRLTEGAWDGTDSFGSQLAKGVYLYKFSLPNDGMEVDTYKTSIDGFFTKGYGKMVILR